MNFDWYFAFNLTEFLATGLTSRTVQVIIDQRGVYEILITKGEVVSVFFDDVFLSLELNDRNPFIFENRAVYLKENGDVCIGFAA